MSFFRSGTDGTKASTHKEKLILLALLALAGVYIPVLVPTTILCAPGEARTLNLLIRSQRLALSLLLHGFQVVQMLHILRFFVENTPKFGQLLASE